VIAQLLEGSEGLVLAGEDSGTRPGSGGRGKKKKKTKTPTSRTLEIRVRRITKEKSSILAGGKLRAKNGGKSIPRRKTSG